MITIAELTANDIGKTVEIFGGDWRIEGRLRGIDAHADVFHEWGGGMATPTPIQGPTTYTLSIGSWESGDLPPGLPVRIERGQR